MRIPFPSELLIREAHLVDAFAEESLRLGLTVQERDEAFGLLPLPVKQAPSFEWFLSPGQWRYYFGTPFTQAGTPVAHGTPQAPAVAELVRAARVASQYLSPEALVQWLGQLANPDKHSDALVEMLAVANVPGGVTPVYEPLHLGTGAKRIDWLVPGSPRSVLLEIKNRLGPLAQELERLRPHMEAGLSGVPGTPVTNFEALFRSSFEEFLPTEAATHIQGVLLFPGMKVPGLELSRFFKEKLSNQLHFIALSTDGHTVHLESQAPDVASAVLGTLGWVPGADLLF